MELPENYMQDRKTDLGPPKYDQFWPEVIKSNYGKWKLHKILEPGLYMHESETGEKVFTLRCAGTRLMSTLHIEDICKIADQFCDGFVRFTTRNNIEFMVDDETKVGPLKARPGGQRCPAHRRHRRRRDQHRPYPGLDSLPHPGHRCLRTGQVGQWMSCSTTSLP